MSNGKRVSSKEGFEGVVRLIWKTEHKGRVEARGVISFSPSTSDGQKSKAQGRRNLPGETAPRSHARAGTGPHGNASLPTSVPDSSELSVGTIHRNACPTIQEQVYEQNI
ncbi:hypothetical protein Fot_11126 [Forsythia ovata]|uniref:Uncharacterized protein n=1 Tax=Forsythia ovata TaxID=205694 RepID=A0ABD1WIU8_9LAMI